MNNLYQTVIQSDRYRSAKRELLTVIEEASAQIQSVRPPQESTEVEYSKLVEAYTELRGRGLLYPLVGSGMGHGPFLELADGSVKLDMITGIGVYFFGHSHPELMDAMIDTLPNDAMQGNLQPASEAKRLLESLLSQVGDSCNLKYGWLTCSGTMANEMALKIIRQKRAPAHKIFAFENCFCGRSTAMQELTDNPKYREGQPTHDIVTHLPFFSSDLSLEENVERTLGVMKKSDPSQYAGLMIELVQGEGGFYSAPRDYYVRIFEYAREAGLAIWVDEVQTFGRTGELFAYQTFGLEEYVDVVTVGKLLQACAVLYTEEYNPRPGLVAGTFSGSTAALATGRRILELYQKDRLLGPDGKISKRSRFFREKLEANPKISEVRATGGMIAFTPYGGEAAPIKAYLQRLFEKGVIAFICGHGPYSVRMLPPLPVMEESHIEKVCEIIDETLD